MAGTKSLMAQIEDGTATLEGNPEVLTQLASTMVHFEVGFEIMPGTKAPTEEKDLNPFQVSAADADP